MSGAPIFHFINFVNQVITASRRRKSNDAPIIDPAITPHTAASCASLLSGTEAVRITPR
jgi:hypothetical protein